MSKKIVVILSTINSPYCNKRIAALQDTGISMDIYGYERKGVEVPKDLPYSVITLGGVSEGDYKRRVGLYIKTLRGIAKKYNNEETTYYLFGLDIAMFFLLFNKKVHYLYDECDLTHTYMGFGSRFLELIDKKIIQKASLTITTSEGFIQYHFGDKRPGNIVLAENKLDKKIIDYKPIARCADNEKLSIGFVGYPRFNSVYNFIDVFCSNYPNFDFHVFGGPVQSEFQSLSKYPNCHFHGFFQNPQDLPMIYSSIDLVLCTYDIVYDNVRYAEPNKLYESIYFNTPIIVSSKTFLAEKVKRLGVGYEIDAMNKDSIVSFISNISKESIEDKKKEMRKIDKIMAVRDDNELVNRICIAISKD